MSRRVASAAYKFCETSLHWACLIKCVIPTRSHRNLRQRQTSGLVLNPGGKHFRSGLPVGCGGEICAATLTSQCPTALISLHNVALAGHRHEVPSAVPGRIPRQWEKGPTLAVRSRVRDVIEGPSALACTRFRAESPPRGAADRAELRLTPPAGDHRTTTALAGPGRADGQAATCRAVAQGVASARPRRAIWVPAVLGLTAHWSLRDGPDGRVLPGLRPGCGQRRRPQRLRLPASW